MRGCHNQPHSRKGSPVRIAALYHKHRIPFDRLAEAKLHHVYSKEELVNFCATIWTSLTVRWILGPKGIGHRMEIAAKGFGGAEVKLESLDQLMRASKML